MNQNPVGLIYSPESILAMLAGTKTRTSKLRGSQVVNANPIIDTVSSEEWDCDVHHVDGIRMFHGWPHKTIHTANQGDRLAAIKCPWHIGQHVYAKERHCFDVHLSQNPDRWHVLYDIPAKLPHISNYEDDKKNFSLRTWRAPLSMPRWAARPELFRTITGIICERIGSISEEDAFAEGIVEWEKKYGNYASPADTYRDVFQELWNSLHAKPKPVRDNSQWAKALEWYSTVPQGDPHDEWEVGSQIATIAAKDDIVGYISFPFAESDGDLRETINGKPHKRVVSPFVWCLTFKKRANYEPTQEWPL